MRITPFLALGLVPVLLMAPGCATITKSSNQMVTVNTRPAGAECTLEREGQTIAVINPTPGTISVEKDKDVISVVCRKPDYLDSDGTLDSEFEAMTFGNIIFGGIIGVGVDAASGAMHEYPPLVTITLIPAEFASVEQRDTFFDGMRDDLLRESDKVKERIGKKCMDEDCDRQLLAADSATKKKLGEIEAQRLAAKISVDEADAQIETLPGKGAAQ